MFFEIAAVILPVFLLVILGFFACSVHLLEKWFVDNLAKLCQDFGIPFLLFFNLAILDLDKAFDFRILISFYSSMIISFFLISSTSFFIFNKPYKSCVVLGFCAMFSNAVLLGLPNSELAYGVDSLSVNYTIIIGHAPLCYLVGIAFIEVANANNQNNTFLVSLKSVFKAIVLNNLTIGILLGISFNLIELEFSTHTEDLL